MPVVIGRKQLANFTSYGLPNGGAFLIRIFAIGITLLAVMEFSRARQESKHATILNVASLAY